MKWTGRLISPLLLLSCSCSLMQRDAAPTIASLGKRPLEVQDSPVQVSETRAIQAYREFLHTGDDSGSRPEAMRRLADLQLEAEELPQAGEDAAPAEAVPAPQPAADSVQLYRDILSLYPDRANNDRVMYQLARAYEQSGQMAESLAMLNQLIAQYPHSDHIDEARFRRGEMLFMQKNYREATHPYAAVVGSGPGGPFYRQSLYKLGWCYFKQSEFDAGLDAFMELFDRQLVSATGGDDRLSHLSKGDRELLEDALRVVSLSFSYQDGPISVVDYFGRHGNRPYEDVIYDNLGRLYLHKERYTDAAQTFRAFMEHNRNHRQAPLFQMRVIETYEKGDFPSLVLQGKREFVDRYNLQADYWQHHPTEEAGEVIDFLKLTLTDLARHYHALAQRTRKAGDYRQATRWYRTYLGSFPESDEAPQMNFLLAELLFESGQFRLAAREYEHTAYDYGLHEKAADAGYAAVLASDREETRLQGEAKTAWHRQSLENSLRFATTFPAHPQAMTVLTRSSENLLALGELERAAQVSQQVIDSPQATPAQQRVAWTVQAHARFDLNDYLQAERAYQQVLQLTPTDSEAHGRITEKLAASIYKQGEEALGQGETSQAVGHFLRVRTMTPAASIVATAEYDAAAGLMTLQDWDAAATVLKRFRAAYPDDSRQAEVTRRLATAYLAEAQPLEAAAEFERIGRSGADESLSRDALWQAAELYNQGNQSGQASSVYRDYIARFPQPAEAAIEARHRVAGYYLASGDTAQQRHWLNEIITADRQAGAGRTDRTRYLAAMASFSLAETAFEGYRSVSLSLPLDKSLARKKQLMQQALQEYEQAAAYQVAEVATGATFRTADIYYHLSQALLASERPGTLSGDALAQYEILLEEQAYPFEEQAIELHEANIRRISSGVYDRWVAMSLQQLAELVPARYARNERSVRYVEAIH